MSTSPLPRGAERVKLCSLLEYRNIVVNNCTLFFLFYINFKNILTTPILFILKAVQKDQIVHKW